ncbi:prepilin peptidase [Pasteurellaceae bacterium LIM206]|nr:prepilin peptidase [Pasteurellaceae bacterium LIM206]
MVTQTQFAVIFCYTVIIILLGILSYTDAKKRILSNRIIGILPVFVILMSFLKYGTIFIVPAFFAFIIGFILFLLKVVGGGDVKLVSVLMLSIPYEQILYFFFFTTLFGLLIIIIGWLLYRQSIRNDGLPYGIAISLGFMMTSLLFSV